MWIELTSDLFRRLISKIPGWFVGFVYRSDRIAKLIDINLRSNGPIILNLNADVPEISLYFHINNRSPFALTLDRLIIKLWIGQPVLEGFMLRRYAISKGNFLETTFIFLFSFHNCRKKFLRSIAMVNSCRRRFHLKLQPILNQKLDWYAWRNVLIAQKYPASS